MEKHVAVLGCAWGDEGKGKIVHSLAPDYDYIIRFNGGNNAGHTVVVDDNTYKFHLLPSGILYPDKVSVLANGVVIDPKILVGEIENIESKIGKTNFRVSHAAHVILPYHRKIDGLEGKKVGTTGRGIGPCYQDKVARKGIRIEDLVDSDGEIRTDHFRNLLEETLEAANFILTQKYHEKPFELDDIVEEYTSLAQVFAENVTDTSALLYNAGKKGKRFLFEGAQGIMLDPDIGTYPYVTSSHPTTGGIFTGTGLYFEFDRIIGVVKAYTTRVGEGPMTTELGTAEQTKDEKKDEPFTDENRKKAEAGDEYCMGKFLRKKGVEYGTTTERPRRCGWLDLCIVNKKAKPANGLTELAITKLDVLSDMPSCNERITVCLDYEPPQYAEYPRWQQEIADMREYRELPRQAQQYVQAISNHTELPIKLVSVGPATDALINCDIKPY